MFDFVLWTVAWQDCSVATMVSIEKFRHNTPYKFFWTTVSGDALIGRSRSVSLSLFLKDDVAPHIVFLDSDIVFEPHHLNKLVEDMKSGYDLIGGLYVLRDGSQPASYSRREGFAIDGEIHEVEFVSTGFMGISRNLMERMVKKLKLPKLNEGEWGECYPFFESGRSTTERGRKIYISEDWDFCQKARKVGVKSYLDTGIQVGHQGSKIWTVEDLKKHLEQKKEASAPKEEAEKENDESTGQSV